MLTRLRAGSHPTRLPGSATDRYRTISETEIKITFDVVAIAEALGNLDRPAAGPSQRLLNTEHIG
ncbi:MAG: hypothetical protein ACRDTG_22260 [Pseudonocardiaceae bacterium]